MEPLEPPPPEGPEERPASPLDDATAPQRDEVRKLVDAGAASPEELRELAETLRRQRAAEEEAWRAKVRPELMEAKKGGFRMALRREPQEGQADQWRFLLVVGPAVLLATVLLVVTSSPLVILVFLVALVVYAWVLGRRPPPPEGPGDVEGGR